MATARLTIGSVLDTVTMTATTITGALGAVSGVVSMANAYVGQAQKQQLVQHIIDNERFEERIIEEAAFDQAETDLKISAYRSKSAQHQLGYDQAYERYKALLAAPKADEQKIIALHAA